MCVHHGKHDPALVLKHLFSTIYLPQVISCSTTAGIRASTVCHSLKTSAGWKEGSDMGVAYDSVSDRLHIVEVSLDGTQLFCDGPHMHGMSLSPTLPSLPRNSRNKYA